MAAGPGNTSFNFPPLIRTETQTSWRRNTKSDSAFDDPAHVSLTFNGVEGFPVVPAIGTYELKLDIPGQICIDVSEDNSPAVKVAPVQLQDFKTFNSPAGEVLTWSYSCLPSRAMAPKVFFRHCWEDISHEREAEGQLFYDSASHTWTFDWNTLDKFPVCKWVTIRSGLTGQEDGPFTVR